MFTTHPSHRPLQGAVCLFFSAVIVASTLAMGFVGAQSLEREAQSAFAAVRG